MYADEFALRTSETPARELHTWAAVEVGDDTEGTRDEDPHDVDAQSGDNFVPALDVADEDHGENEEDGSCHECEGRDHAVNHENCLQTEPGLVHLGDAEALTPLR